MDSKEKSKFIFEYSIKVIKELDKISDNINDKKADFTLFIDKLLTNSNLFTVAEALGFLDWIKFTFLSENLVAGSMKTEINKMLEKPEELKYIG